MPFRVRVARGNSRVERDDARREAAELNRVEAGGAEQRGEVLGTRKAPHAGRQVRVRGAAGKHLSGDRNEHVEPQPEERARDADRPRDLKDAEPTSGPENAAELTERGREGLDRP